MEAKMKLIGDYGSYVKYAIDDEGISGNLIIDMRTLDGCIPKTIDVNIVVQKKDGPNK